MVVSQRRRMDNATYERMAISGEFLRTELHDGVLVEKPVMSRLHGDLGLEVAFLLRLQVDPMQYRVRANHAKLAIPGRSYYIPDVAVLEAAVAWPTPKEADLYHDPVPLVVEIWSPKTGGYDIAVKLPGYRFRGDAEIWWVDARGPSVTRWLRRPDGGYDESVHTGGILGVTTLPGVTIDLDALFAAARPDNGRDR